MKKIIFFILILSLLGISYSQLDFNKIIIKEKETGNVKLVKEKDMNFVLNPGNTRNYKVVKEVNIDEMQIKFYEVEHIKTKCKIVLAVCDDDNKAFTIGFKTYPYSDNGICHIMEHSTLCGSRKYNVKDPFFSINKTTLASFMNAVTFNDATLYPIASVNMQDYKNLMDLYLDAVFFPNFKNEPNILKQEGWHYEIENANSDLGITGVVYNEMKGDMSNPINLLDLYKYKDMFPNTPYAFNYGGDPSSITSLTQDEFLDFHEKYYHPSNAIIYIYGNVDMNERLEYLHKEYLSNFDYQEINYPIYTVDPAAITDGQYFYSEDSGAANKAYLSYNFVYNDNRDPVKKYVNKILNYILFDKEGALISDVLKKNGLGESVYCETGLMDDKSFVNIIAENIDEKNKNYYKKAIDNELLRIFNEGINERVIKSAINTLYISVSEPTNAWSTKGIDIFIRMFNSYLYNFDIENCLAYKEAFDAIRNVDLNDKNNIFMQCFKEMYITPLYSNMTVLSPKKGLNIEKENAEKKRLSKLKDEFKLNKNGISLDAVIYEYNDLIEWMHTKDSDEALLSLPKLSINDIEREAKNVTYQIKDIYGRNVVYTDGNAGDIVYISVDFKLPHKEDIEESDKYYIALLSNLLGTLATKNYSYEDLNTELDLYTGGFTTALGCSDDDFSLRCMMKATKDKIQDAYRLMYEIIYNTKFDDYNRIEQKIKEMKNISNQLIIDNGHTSTLYRALSNYSFGYDIKDKTEINGIGFNMFINDLVNEYKQKSDKFSKAIEKVRNAYCTYDRIYLDCCTSNQNYDIYSKSTKTFLQDVASLQLSIDENDYTKLLKFEDYKKTYNQEVFLFDSNVNFISRGSKLGDGDGLEKYDSKRYVLLNIIKYDYLHNKIRVENGAYGYGMSTGRSGIIHCYSYRDPKFAETDDVYKNINSFLNTLRLSEDDLKDTIIGTMKQFDQCLLPLELHNKNFSLYHYDIDNDKYNKERQAILDMNMNDIDNMKQIFENIWDNSSFCALVGTKFETEAKKLYKITKKLNFN